MLEIRTATGATAVTTNSATFTDLATAAATVTVPAGAQHRIIARFTAESACYGGAGAQYCGVRIVIGGTELEPAVGNDFAFDSTDNGTETANSWESHAIERSAVLGGGTHTVQVQWRTTDTATTLRLDDWHLAVERVAT